MNTLAMDVIRIDGGTQPRARIDQSVVDEYAEAMMSLFGEAFIRDLMREFSTLLDQGDRDAKLDRGEEVAP